MSTNEWHRVAATSEVVEEEPKSVMVGDKEICIYEVEGDYYATDNICTHAWASLASGYQEGDEIECPLHEGRFNIKTGKALCAPVDEDLATYEVKVEGSDIFVKV